MIIYKTTNQINGKIYIGKDKYNNPKYLGSGKIFKLAIKKYGRENFIKEILDFCNSEDEMNEKEVFWIDKMNSREREIGYNISPGGIFGDSITYNPNKKEICKKISESNKGRKWTEEQRERMIEILTGHEVTEETRKKISETRKNKKIKPSKKSIDGTIKRLKEQKSGENNINAKKFYLFSPEGEMYITNGNLPTFCKEHDINVNVLRNWVDKGKIPPTPKKENKIRNNTIGWEIRSDIDVEIKDPEHYILTSPQGKEYKIYNGLKKFCKDNKLWYWTISDYIDKGKVRPPVIKFTDERLNSTGWEIKKYLNR